jgi:hypothetical protein
MRGNHFWGQRSSIFNGSNRGEWIFGGRGPDTLFGGGGHDAVFGWKGADLMDGEAGNDVLRGGRGNDTITGGAGSDVVFGGRGNDLLTFDADLNAGARDYYDGGSGTDTAQISLSKDIWLSDAFQADLASLYSGAASQCYGGFGHRFHFESLGLRVRSIENFEFIVDGEVASGADDDVDALDDASDILNNETSVTGNVLDTGSVPDLVANVSLSQQAQYGTVSVDADGNYTFVLDVDAPAQRQAVAAANRHWRVRPYRSDHWPFRAYLLSARLCPWRQFHRGLRRVRPVAPARKRHL